MSKTSGGLGRCIWCGKRVDGTSGLLYQFPDPAGIAVVHYGECKREFGREIAAVVDRLRARARGREGAQRVLEMIG